MWKPLISMQRVNSGDKIRYLHPDVKKAETLFKVVKTDEHYFELLPAVDEADLPRSLFATKIVRYFDIGYTIQIEVWDDCV
ncbi:hypothetical protein A4H97_25465 [Niastella yeongjuensis]|uniref:Uncharacterized protein n=1 Tax=Niastella yeongjuensis TaxID=354355 RepID=A0A1V9F0R6_9BACT|nr:hypothetical protein [Niastella yeongjuensis]OQP51971.1 hypothetical protein A4H97_25465 [Niastella yeongjuensis]SEP35900.1 hypothetical protein SAMN05660816_05437 [Niastella yeongjuensis]